MIIVTGSIAWDYIMDFPGSFGDHILPREIHKINLSFIVSKFARRRGGTAGNVSYSLGLLKTPHILFSTAGKDFGEYKKEFRKNKIDTSHVVISKKQTATGFAMTDKNNNQIWGYFYGAAELNIKLKLSSIKELSKNDLVLVGPTGSAGSMAMVRQCIENKISYIFDPGFILTQIDNNDLALGVKSAKFIMGNDYEIDLIKSRIDWKKIFQSKIIVTTLGDKGAKIEAEDKTYDIPICKIEKVVDPTGAGDAWRSGFLAGLNRGYNFQICGQIGSVAASYAVEKYGTQEHKYTINGFKKRYRQAFGSLIEL